MPLTILSRRLSAGVLGELDHRSGGAVVRVRDGEDERLDVALEECPDTHRARLERREDRGTGQAVLAELPGRLAQRDDDRVGGGVVRLPDPIVGPRDHRLVDDGDRGDRALAQRQGILRLGERLPHEQLVVHGGDDTGRGSLARLGSAAMTTPFGTQPQPNRLRDER